MNITFSATITYDQGECTSSGAMIFGNDDIFKTVLLLAKYIQYYQGLGLRIIHIELAEVCKVCDGKGTVPYKYNKLRSKKCPECKGDAINPILDIGPP